MNLQISDIANDSIVDGPGLRMTVFTQGCPHNCIGCHNPQTHTANGGKTIDTKKLIQIISENPLLDGITLSGGDPFLQPTPCAELAEMARQKGLTVWTYTGYTFEELISSENNSIITLLEKTDVLVDGRFEQKNRSLELSFRGSKNQRLINVKESLACGTAVLVNKFM